MRRILAVGVVCAIALVLALPVSAQSPAVHVVQRGENLFRIALRYGVTVDALAKANGLSDPRLIYAGQRLIVPAGPAGSARGGATTRGDSLASRVHVVQRGENLYRIALRYGTSFQALALANGIVNPDRIYAGQRLEIPGLAALPSLPQPARPSGQTYVVRRGDTLSAIALRRGVSVWALVQANGIRNPSLIYAGQVLLIPGARPVWPSQPAPAAGGHGGRWIDVDLGAQQLIAYEGDTSVRRTLVSTGLPRTPTLVGQYRIYAKYASASMTGPGYYLPNVPYVMYYDRGYSLHGTYWHANFGSPMSHGCINLPTAEARWLYSWAPVGTPIHIHR